eukprot:TRINITY_DN40747_c0_g1_i1.p1 TRINITY_DN40747_c0_g1~~TRINITY_DN40747_c0_g1_i1.p1  ORF type:complete len:361 (-),score=73.65 TRINITY_DN40747_c0_g1_i1:271-1353(-)
MAVPVAPASLLNHVSLLNRGKKSLGRRPRFSIAIIAGVAIFLCGAWATLLNFQTLFVGAGRSTVSRTSNSRTSMAAETGVKRTFLKKGQSYKGRVDPKLRSLLESSEYRRMVTLLSGLDQQDLLDDFLEKAEKYWEKVNLAEWAAQEQQGGGRGLMRTVKKEWPRIWPSELESERMPAFELFALFWTRVDQSSLIDRIMSDVLPDFAAGFNNKGNKDSKKLEVLTEEGRRQEIMKRLGKNELIGQYGALSKADPEVARIGPKMTPFIARFLSILESKASQQTTSLGGLADGVVALVLVVAVLVLAVFGGALPNPFAGETVALEKTESSMKAEKPKRLNAKELDDIAYANMQKIAKEMGYL